MTGWPTDDPVQTFLEEMLAALRTNLAATDAGCPERTFIAGAGSPAWDCPDQAWVRAVNWFPSIIAFPSSDNRPAASGPIQFALLMEAGVTRPVSTIGRAPDLPSAVTLTADAQTLLQAQRALRSLALLRKYRRDLVQQSMNPLGPSGGIGGATVQIAWRFTDCPPAV
jgi:hypothetical protein